MPFCPNCKYEYLPEIETCPDCKVRLVQTLQSPAEPEPEELVPCWRTNNFVEADVISNVLKENHIPFHMEVLGGLADGAIPTPSVHPNSYTVFVPENKAEEARKLIEEERASEWQVADSGEADSGNGKG